MATSPVSILIRWGRVPCINRNSNITGYTVRYSTGGGSTVNVSVSGTGRSERTYIATLLLPNTSYTIQVAADTSTGVTGPFSTTVNEATSPPQRESIRCCWLRMCNTVFLQQISHHLFFSTSIFVEVSKIASNFSKGIPKL